ncbi:MAG: T9SS type A sorting domain-containing protein [Chitinophagales bacterium]|nr:T9SS type A sorting domain-containing protein [Chitinophagales bacterium]
MNNFFSRCVVSCVLLTLWVQATGQYNSNIPPRSQQVLLHTDLPQVVLTPPDLSEIALSDSLRELQGALPLFSRNIPCRLSLHTHFAREVTNEGAVYRVKIRAAGAKGLVLLLEKLYIPPNGTLHVYTPDHRVLIGAYTNENTPSLRAFNAGVLPGDEAVLEFFEPHVSAGEGVLHINEVGYAYRWVDWLEPAQGGGGSSYCQVNVACSEGNNWQDQQRSVARIIVVVSGGQGYCTGALVNNQLQNCIPYFLTAQHCILGSSPSEFSQYIFYFNYQASQCNGISGPTSQIINGCTKIADSNDNGGDNGSDFALLKLSSTPPLQYNVFYAGWNVGTAAPQSGVCIHHPNGDIKKISTYTTPPGTIAWGTMPGSHWNVTWSATVNGHGVTEPGSSGAPLFNQNGLIVGTLTGGDSYCNTPTNPDQFGKMSKHWTANGNANIYQLKPWLDPNNTGITLLYGTSSPCSGLVANDAGIISIVYPTSTICSNSFSPVVALRNYGNNSLQSVKIHYQIGASNNVYNWSGNLASGSSVNVTLPQVTVSPGQYTFTCYTQQPNNTTDGNTSNDQTQKTFIIGSELLKLYIKTDTYGDETTWSITDAQNVIVASGGPYVQVTGGNVYNENICLGPGCYKITFYDSYGDGMYDPDAGVSGTFKLTGQSGSPVYAQLSSPHFGDSVSYNFCINPIGLTEPVYDITVFPNPSRGVFQLVGLPYPVTVRVYNTRGQEVSRVICDSAVCKVNLSGMAPGIYMLNVLGEGVNHTFRLLLE